jgi:hypothetical protein
VFDGPFIFAFLTVKTQVAILGYHLDVDNRWHEPRKSVELGIKAARCALIVQSNEVSR